MIYIKKHNRKKWSPYIIIIIGFLSFIIIGTGLLLLPFSVNDGYKINFVDSLFTATSSVCVTGLSVVPDVGATFSVFGKIVIAILIQLGGLGFVTTTMFIFTLLGLKIGLNDRLLIRETLNQNSSRGLVKFVKKVIIMTFIFEFFGFLLNFVVFINEFSFLKAIGISAFHAISSFNNAGFDILGDSSLINYSSNTLLLLNTSFLIIMGGMGFLVINDVLNKKSFKKLSLHSKIVIIMTVSLLIVGMLIIKLTEGSNITWLQSFFQSVSTRTAGFTSIDCSMLRNSSLIITLFLMLVGASPCSTGGGLKTTTLFVIIASIKSFITGKPPVVFYRRLSHETVSRAYILTLLSLLFILFFVFILCITESAALGNGNMTLTQLTFEIVSAYGTVGLSMGTTTLISSTGRFIFCFIMFTGRLGPITIISIINKNWNKKDDNSIIYPEGKVVIG
jgi:trk system potassium uptake protein TrkH